MPPRRIFANVKYGNYLQQPQCFQILLSRREVEDLGYKMLLFIFWVKHFFPRNSVTFHVDVPIFIILPLTVFARIIALFYPPSWRMCFHFERNYADFVVPLFCSLQVPFPRRVKRGLSACLPMTNGGRRWGLWGEEEESGAQRLEWGSSSAKPRGHRQRKREAVRATN